MKTKARETHFTLIELMVVVSIVVILVSLLLPALSKARASAARTLCSNKMKQIGTQVFFYSEDYRGYLPPYGKLFKISSIASLVYWNNYINYYYFQDKVIHALDNPSMNFTCPSDTSPYNYQGLVNSYGFNPYIMPGFDATAAGTVQKLSTPSEIYLISDSIWTSRWSLQGYSDKWTPPFLRLDHNHSNGMFYADGHIGYLSSQPAAPTSNAPWYSR